MAAKKSRGTVSHEIASTGANLPAVFKTGAAADAIIASLNLPSSVKVVGIKSVTRPVLKQVDNIPIAVKIISPIRKGEIFKQEGRDDMKPADICFVVNLQTGEEQTLVCNAALKSALERTYEDDGYNGRYFAIISQKRPHKETRTIREYFIKELELENPPV